MCVVKCEVAAWEFCLMAVNEQMELGLQNFIPETDHKDAHKMCMEYRL